MRKLICFLLCFCFLTALPCPAFASELWIIDQADLLTADEEAHLTEQIDSVRQDYLLDIVILTVYGTGSKSVQTYADDYYDEKGYGYGDNRTGVLLLIDMESREWYISTCGDAIYAMTDYSLDVLGQELVYFLGNGDYYDAFENFINSIPKYMLAYQQGQPIDGYVQPDAYYPESGDEIVYYEKESDPNHFLSLLIGAVAALITILIMRSQMNTARAKKHAVDYLKKDTYHLRICRDLYLYSRVTKTPKPQNNGGGGSSVHKSSGGVSHGGRGGKF